MNTCEKDYGNDEIQIYKEVLQGKVRKQFPNGFWLQSYGKNSAKQCTKYLFDIILKCKTKKDYINHCNIATFKKYKLKGMVTVIFKNSPINAFIYSYGETFIKPWEFNQSPKGFWKNKDNVKELIIWLLKKEKINRSNIYEKYNYNLFLKNGVSSALDEFDYSPFKALNYTYPGKYKAYLFTQSYFSIWEDKKNIISVLTYVFKKNNITDSNIYEKYNNNLFISNGQKSLLKYYNNNSFEILEDIYPGKYDMNKFKWITKYKDNSNIKI